MLGLRGEVLGRLRLGPACVGCGPLAHQICRASEISLDPTPVTSACMRFLGLLLPRLIPALKYAVRVHR